MSSLDFDFQGRESPVKAIEEKKDNEAQARVHEDSDDMSIWRGHESLKDQVHDSIHILVRLGYDFDTILRSSKVSRSFLEQSFREMGYCKYKSDLDIITSDEDKEEDKEESGITRTDKKSIQVEIQLFMMRVQLEINKFSMALDHIDDEVRLKDNSLRESLKKKKETLLESFNKLFDKMAEKEDEINIQQKKKNQLGGQEKLVQPEECSTLTADENVPSVLVDSGFIKIARSTAQDFQPYRSIVSHDRE